MPNDIKNLLLSDLKHFGESLWRNEEVGEKRVNFLLGLVTAVAAGLAALARSELAAERPTDVADATVAVLAGLLVVGVATYLRILKRNEVTDEYKSVVDYLREEYVKAAGAKSRYELPFAGKGRSLWSGGLTTLVAAINSIIVAYIVAFESKFEFAGSKPLMCVCGFALGVGLHVAIRRIREVAVRQEALPRSEFYRASVGAVITDGQGNLLVFQRKDEPGNWQFIQGGIEEGEDPLDALERETKEESGIRILNLELLSEYPGLLAYELPPEHRSKKTGRGQTQQWFLLKHEPGKQAIKLPPESEFRASEWMTFRQLLPDEVVGFRQDVYSKLMEEFGDKV